MSYNLRGQPSFVHCSAAGPASGHVCGHLRMGCFLKCKSLVYCVIQSLKCSVLLRGVLVYSFGDSCKEWNRFFNGYYQGPMLLVCETKLKVTKEITTGVCVFE